ncbi:hypothetical protein ROA7450_01026 [Roseovarius albus]|uniref:Glycerophosphoryl diester phosphodiesterase membrane domain-containing protein n=1 Tax=Roseovarius albus TaxID=1247867 RepID=A0A1X6YLW9_9RHOB|nr:hypothetical protein [Roseovarius albus]SLN24976.1 hypothetical protein ROA7450_01026 [Roseovarius albus]
MAVNSVSSLGEPLGVGSIIGESFTIFFRKFFTVLILAFVPTLIGLVVTGQLVGWGLAMGDDTNISLEAFSGMGFALSMVIQFAVYGLSTALLVQMAYDSKLGRPANVAAYFSRAVQSIVPITLLSIVAGILIGLASLALVVPGLWLYAVFSVLVPAVVIDRAGFGALGRSTSLTKEYRWPVLGSLILIGICSWALSFALTFVLGLVGIGFGGAAVGAVSIVLFAAITGVSYGLSAVAISLIYARLREIKEGTSMNDLASVFE